MSSRFLKTLKSGIVLPVLLALVLTGLFSLLLFSKPTITGYAVVDHTDIIDETFYETSESVWIPSNLGLINSVNLNGRIAQGSDVKVYLDNGLDSLLVFNSNNLLVDQTIVNVNDGDIGLTLEYNFGTEFDADDDGVETVDGVVDIKLNTDVISSDKLCTKWEVYSYDDDLTNTVCYGNDNCCSFLDLGSTGEWDDVFYLNYGKLGATTYNKVSAIVVDADYNLSVENAYSNVSYSSWYSVIANFLPDFVSLEEVCEETCSGLNLTDESFVIDVKVNSGQIRIDEMVYGVEEEIVLNGNVSLNVTTNVTVTEEEFKQGNVKIGKPVKWIKKVKKDDVVDIPEFALNYSVKKDKEKVKWKEEDKT